jgi:DNA-binding SARP family transcriptional activator
MTVRAQTGRKLTVRLFGPLSVEDGAGALGPRSFGGTRPKQVLEILLAARGHLVPTERLAELLWGHDRPQDAAGSLQTFVSVLRRHLSADREWARELVVTESEAYRFATELVAIDLDCFDELLERSAGQSSHAARASLEQALALVRGDVLEDEPYATWALDLRGSYQGRVLGARLEAADAALAEHDFLPALTHAEAASKLDRFSERACRSEMLALYALGRHHEALERYRNFRFRIDEELGLEPTAATRSLEAAIIRQESLDSLLPRPIKRAGTAVGNGRISPLLGRTTELETLRNAVHEALASGVALIQIEGEAGFGKTRLLDELEKDLEGIRIGRAGCSELERHLPYVPLAAAVRDALADVNVGAQCLPALAEILPELRRDEPRREFDDVDVLEALFAVLDEHSPLVLVLDDLHWSDPQTVAALGYLRRRGGSLATALVTTVRSGETLRSDPLRRLAADTLVRLGPLSQHDLDQLGIPDLHVRTGGNPRFVVEALASGQPGPPSENLMEALVAQCRAEGPWGYRVLVNASIVEQPFDPESLAGVLDVDPTALVEELDRLCERRILRVDGFRFRFRYDLVRQALQGSVSPARQRLLQRRLDTIGADLRVLPGEPTASPAA